MYGVQNSDAPSGHKVSHAVHDRSLQGSPALSRVGYFLEYLVALSLGIVSEGFKLLCEGVAASCSSVETRA